MTVTADPAPRMPRRPLLLAGALLVGELAAIGLVFKHGIDFDCGANWSRTACSSASLALVALYCVLGALALFAMLRPDPLRRLLSEAGTGPLPLLVNLAGAALAFVPVLLLTNGAGTAPMGAAFAAWTLGMALILGGLALYLAPPAAWRRFLTENGTTLAPLTLVAAATPWLSRQIQPLWSLDSVADATFAAVTRAIRFLGYDVSADPATKVIGTPDFLIAVDPVCSGVEGFALVTLFVSLYLWLFRAEMRFPRALILYPIGIAASATFNVVRITALLVIGLEGNPELAVGGFHSHAGWLMFTLVALGIVALARSVPALRRDAAPAARTAPLPFWRDPVVARILPFAVFMLSALAASTLSQTPGAVYPLRMLAVVAVLVPFWSLYRRLDWRLDPLALAGGAAIGLMWVLIPVEPGPAPYGALTGGLLVLWFVIRGLGTVLVVPLIEELFFRDYLEGRLRLGDGRGWTVLAALISAGLFAALHARWAEAFVAGLVFSALARRGRVTDAILAHAVANVIVYGIAVIGGNLSII